MSNFLSKNLSFLRKNKGLNQAEMASLLDLERSTYANYENGRTEPKFDILEKIVLKIGIEGNKLLFSDLSKGKGALEMETQNLNEKGKDNRKDIGKGMEENAVFQENSYLKLAMREKDRMISAMEKTIKYLEKLNELKESQVERLSAQLEDYISRKAKGSKEE